MRTRFVERVIRETFALDSNAMHAQWLAVCAGQAERDAFLACGISDATISNLDERMSDSDVAPFAFAFEDAQRLSFADRAFDYVFVSDGLHHCSSPHRALLEMYRVCRRGIVVIESRDSLLMRLAERTGLTARYEIDAVTGNGFTYGGVDNSQIPNFVYRWTEREFEKTIKSFDPASRHRFHYCYGLNLPERRGIAGTLIGLAAPALSTVTTIFPRQRNSFAMVALRPSEPDAMWPWLKREGDSIVFERAYVD